MEVWGEMFLGIWVDNHKNNWTVQSFEEGVDVYV